MPTTPCLICRVDTESLGTKMCDRCWELNSRIERDPTIAIRILRKLGKLPRKSTLTKKEVAIAALVDIGWKGGAAEYLIYGGDHA